MMIFAYDHQGIIMADKVPCGKSLTELCYRGFLQRRRRKMHKVRPQRLKTGPLVLHDNARPHMANVVTEKLLVHGWEVLPHPPYSPDMSPPDFDLFPKLKKSMRVRFSSLEELSAVSTQAVQQLDEQRLCLGWNSEASQRLVFGN